MPIVISIAALKGGVGKSTLSINLAAYLHSQHQRVLLVDADSQGTCRGWAAIAAQLERDVPPVVSMGAELRKSLSSVAAGFDVVVIDTPPRLGAEQRAAMVVSDLVLVPVTPGPADLWALTETLQLLEEVRALRPELRAAVVLNRMLPRAGVATATRQAIEQSDVPLLAAQVGARVVFAEATASGQGVCSYAPQSPAAAEIEALAQAALGMLQQGEVAA